MSARRIYKTPDDFPDREFARLTRSTIPLLNYWQHFHVRAVLAQQLGLADLNGAEHEFEYATPVKRPGRGKASMTDLLLRSDRTVVAIEAKWHEPTYPSVREWLTKGNEYNKRNVLHHWLGMFDGFSDHDVDAAGVNNIIYQLLHRAASACRVAGPNRTAIVAYLIFSERSALEGYRAQMEALRDAIRPNHRLRLVALQVPIAMTPTYTDTMEHAARISTRGIPVLIRNAVKEQPLFAFGTPNRTFDTQSHTDDLARAVVPIAAVDRHATWHIIGTGFVVAVLNHRSALVMTAAHLLDHPVLKDRPRRAASALPELVGIPSRRKPDGVDIHAVVGPGTLRGLATVEGAWYQPDIDIALFLMTLPDDAPCQFDLRLSVDTGPLLAETSIVALGYSGASARFAEAPDYDRERFRVSLKIPLIGRLGSVLAEAPKGGGIFVSPGVFVNCPFDSGMSGGPVVEIRDHVAVVRAVIGGDSSDGSDMSSGSGTRAFANVIAPCLGLRALGVKFALNDGKILDEPSIAELIKHRLIVNLTR